MKAGDKCPKCDNGTMQEQLLFLKKEEIVEDGKKVCKDKYRVYYDCSKCSNNITRGEVRYK